MKHFYFSKTLRIAALLMGVMVAQVMVTRANTVTVQELYVSPSATVNVNIPGLYQGGASAGVIKLLVNGILTDAFCIDLHQFSSTSPLPYSVVKLATAPQAPASPMGTRIARVIGNLWTLNYAGALENGDLAAALQVAIWKQVLLADSSPIPPIVETQIVGNYDADLLISEAIAYKGPRARLVALTSDSAQDYVVLRRCFSPDLNNVPDSGSTFILFGLASIALVLFRPRYIPRKY